jgi:hypothetical protein
MGEWLKGRRNALIDGVLVYAVIKWVMPAVVSTVLYLGSSDSGIAALFMLSYLLLLGIGAVCVARAELPDPEKREREKRKYRYVSVPAPRPLPFMMGSRNMMIRVPVNPE